MLTKIIFFVQLLFVCSFTYGQIDREFWFAAPDVLAHTQNYDKPIVVRLTTFTSPATVTISIPSNPSFTPIVTNIPANATNTIDLTTWINDIENTAINTIANKGLLIQSTADITAYYEVVSSYCVCNPEIFALKGKNALGSEFYISSQNTYAIDTVRHPLANTSFDIVATEDNTNITITPSKELVGRPAGIPFTVTLNKGQTFSCVGKYHDKDSHLHGSYLIASKPIAVTLKGDLTFGDGTCADLIGDQTIPTNILGNEYIVTKGYLVPLDRVYVLAIENNTNIYLDGNGTPAATLSKGQTWSFNLSNNSSYIRSDKKVYVYQVTGNGCELGSAIIPKLNCTGSQSVSIVRSSNEPFAVMITTKNGTQNNFTVNGNAGLITAANFSPVPGTGGNYVSARVDLSGSISTGSVVNVSNSAGKFSLGFINGTPVGGCRYGFFSDFKSSNVQKSQTEICNGDSAQLTAFGGITYQWSPATGLSNALIANPKASPSVTTDYKVIITDANGCMDSAFVKVTVNNCVTSCTNWLNLPNNTSYVRMGDLDIPGNVITVEAMFNRTTTWSGGTPYSGDLVSKHIDPNDVNYLLRPHNASITTNNGFFETPAACDIELNKTYHAAMVYDGSTLKFYRDGFLMAQVPASGNLIQNNWPAQIGKYTGNNLETFIGYINEVRIWNVPRSQAEIRQYMNAPIPSPTIQTGLLAYYTFDNTLNKQGNTTWNGTLANGASINATNTNCAYTADSCKKVVVQFTTPDTVCVNTPVTITNTSAGASSYYWNFCVADINTPPAAVNIGNPGNLSSPVFLDYVYVNNNYYGFVTNYNSGNLIRLDFGNSLLNTPTSVNLGNYGGILQTGTAIEGIQVVQNEGRWYAIIVGGTPLGGTQPRIVKIDFGTSITNTGVATNWGNIGNMNQAVDLHIFKENNNWYGFTINAENNTITRFNFTNSFNNTPTATNLGNIGSLAYPTGIYAINDNGFWRVFITNAGDNTRIGPNSSLTRLDFGSSLLNTPTGVNLGNPGNLLQHPRDLTIMKFCGDIVGFAVNGNPNYNNVVRLNFSNDLTLTPTATSLGNTGNLNFPHSISKLFRVNDDVYAFITNVANNTITRLRFAGCTNASVSSSTAQNPQPVTYSAPGTYNINLTIDDGLPTQTSYCKQVVVMPEPIHTPTQAITICTGDSIKIGTGVKYAQYTWNTGAITDSIIANTAGTYWVQTDRYGCTNKDSMEITEIPKPLVDLGPDVTLCEFSNQVLDAGNTGATYLWQDGYTNQTYTATVFGKYYVRVTNPNGCVSSDTITFTKTLITHPIISSTQDVCDPLTIQFNGTGAGLANPWWDFGDGATATGQFNPTHTYAGYGNYTVKFAATVNGCKDTVTQMISVHISTTNLILTPDTTICYNTPKQLRTQPLLGFCWSPTTWLNDPTSPNPVTSTPGKMTYYLTAQVPGANLITNGDFSNGNTGFISTYRYNNPNSIEGEYTVGTNPKTWNNFFGNCVDHTTGNGNMLLVNGAPTPNEVVWSQTVNNIMPNTDYALIAWVQNLNVSGATSNPPTLEFTINGNRLLNVLQPGYTSCVWDRYYTVWNSGASTTANIVLTDLSSIRAGNDFALDDLSFSPISLQRDSVIISVDTPVVMARTDTTVCINAQVQLSATGAATWAWTPVIGLSGATISNPVATVTSNTAYIVAGTTTNGCTAKDTVNINIHPVPTVITDHDLEACPNTAVQLSANSTMSSWSWTPALYVSDATIANPMAAPPHTLTYSVQVKDQYNCAYSDTVQVTLYDPRFTLQGLNRAICKGSSIGLHVTGGDTYLWSPAGSLSDASVANPVATPDTSTTYQVYAKENTCGYDTTMQIRVNVNPTPIVTASKENDVNCVVHTTRLHASGTPGTSYLWAPVTGLDHPNLPDPVSGPDSTTTYFVTGTNQYGCYAIDSVTVYAEAEGKVTFMVPNAFTPNGDSRNDCFGVKSWGGATIEEFTIFNRWGQRVFSSKNATACWDGRYKGEPQPAGGYVYVIKAKTFCGNIKRTGTLVLVR